MVLWVVALSARDTDNALDIVPFADDELLLGLSHGPDDCITVLAWAFEADQGSADFIVQILVAGRELVSEQMQQGKIDFIGTVRIRRMNLRLARNGFRARLLR